MKKGIKITLISLAVLAVVSCIAISLHVNAASENLRKHGTANWQLGKIDFDQDLDSLTKAQAQAAIWKVNGIKQAVFNEKSKTMVFAYQNNGELSHQAVYDQFMANGDFKASLYRPSEESLASGCPVMNNNSFFNKLGKFIQGLFS
ncbi:MAG: hypothetical protein ACPF8V_00500 [Luteibaculum sp.]